MYYFRLCLAVLLLLAGSGAYAPVVAAGPWSFLMELPAAESGVRIDLPTALSIDSRSKRYYVVDAKQGQLVSFDRDGKFLAAFNAGGELAAPVSLARTSSGMLWVINRGRNELLYINSRQQKVERFQPTYPDGSKMSLAKVAVDERDRLFVLDHRRGSILQLDDHLQVVQNYSGGKTFHGFVDFKLKQGAVWALDGQARKVYRFTGDAAPKTVQLAGLQFPVALEVDSAGQFYILDRHAGTVEVYGPAGEKRYDFLGKGKRYGQLWYAKDLLFDWEQRLCIVNEGNARIDILTR